MNPEQTKSLLRSFIQIFGGMIAGWFGAKGWFTVDQVLSVLNSETFISTMAALAMAGWGLFVHTQANAVAVVGAMADDPASPVKAVITTATPEGVALAKAIPSQMVVPAGTQAAVAVAKDATP